MQQRGFITSDLHLYAPWGADSVDSFKRIARAASRADFMVFNGDIFDFRWTTLATTEETVKKAVEWLKALSRSCPDCRFIFIMGNHDNHCQLLQELEKFSIHRDNFEYHCSHAFWGSHLFFHGDLFLTTKRIDPFCRDTFATENPQFPGMRRIYHMLILAGLHHCLPFLYPPKRCAKIIHDTIVESDFCAEKVISDIYFGHTHSAFNNFIHKGVCFHNTGTAIGGFSLKLLEITIDEGGLSGG